MGKSKERLSRKESKQPNQFLKYSGLGMQLLLTVGLSTWFGYWLDEKLDNRFPGFTILFSFLALFGQLFILIKSLSSDDE